MSGSLVRQLEQSVLARNPFLAERLKPGMPESDIRAALSRAGVTGAVRPVVQLYSWKNGTVLDEKVALGKTAFLPGENYQFIDLETALHLLEAMGQAAEYHPGLSGVAGRYLPLLWDGVTGALALDLKPSKRHRVVMIEFESTEPIREAYATFDNFIADVIRANVEDDTLVCLQCK